MSERDLIAELRRYAPWHDGTPVGHTLFAAADELERLAERADRYEKALQEIAEVSWDGDLWAIARTALGIVKP